MANVGGKMAEKRSEELIGARAPGHKKGFELTLDPSESCTKPRERA
jgi:hypothetical protein